MQTVIGHLLLVDVVPDLLSGPFGQWIEFDQTELGVRFDDIRMSASRRLFPPNSRDPGTISFQSPLQRFDFANVAAQIGIRFP